jgi:phosphoribosylanthranilate isomerase
MHISIKICGITRLEDALEAERLGAFAVGFVFYPGSRRFIDPDSAGEISRRLGASIQRVGVFVDERPETIRDTVRRAGLTMVQLHGSESPQFLHGLEGIRIVKAFKVGDGFDPGVMRDYRADYFLLDTFVEGSHGGTGRTFDWNIARSCAGRGKIILAGGLDSGNVARAAAIAQPWGVDVSGGVEGSPGVKDREKMREFFREAGKAGENV